MKLKRSVLSAILFLGLLANAVAQTVQIPSSHENTSVEEILLPPPTGSYPVGQASFHRIDASRPEPFTEDSKEKRQVLFHIWYPAESAGSSPASLRLNRRAKKPTERHKRRSSKDK